MAFEPVLGTALKAEKFAEKPVELDAEMSRDEVAQLRAAIAESDAQIARGEVATAAAPLEDIDRIFSERLRVFVLRPRLKRRRSSAKR